MQPPSVGRIVHFHFMQTGLAGPALTTRPAIITSVPSDLIGGEPVANLQVFYDATDTQSDNDKFVMGASRSDEPTAGFWSWPPRV